MTCVVPHGSVHGPLQFIIYTNYPPNYMKQYKYI